MSCAPSAGARVAVTNHRSGRYMTWTHAAYERGYDGVSKTLCGRRFYDPSCEARGPQAWDSVTCDRCKKSIVKMEATR